MSKFTKKDSRIFAVTAMLVRKAAIKFTLNIAVLLIALLTFASVSQADAPSNEWWDSNYQYRHKISVTAGSTNVPTDYSVRIEFDHAALVAAGKSLASGNDIRIAHWNGSIWTELDRRLDDQSSWDSATTQVWFRTQAAVNANQRDDDYYIYYGYSSAGSPPTTWSSVFLFYDDFNDASLDTGRWTCSGTCNESGGNLTLGTNNSKVWATATYALGNDTRWETRAQLGGDGSVQYFNYCGAGNTNDWSGDWIDFWTTSTTHNLETANNASTTNNNYTPNTPTSFHVYGFDWEGTSGVRFFQDGTEVGYNVTNVPDTNLRFLLHNDNGTNSQTHDWVRVRKYVSPEPSNFIGGEEGYNATFFYRKSIEIQETEVTCTSNVSNFPVMVQLTGADFLEIEDDVDADGFDIIFKAEDDATCGGAGKAPCILDHEIEVYDETNDLLVAWVRIPSLDYNNNTTIYLYYGNAAVTAATENPAGVWDSGYAAVWHLKETVTDEGTQTGAHIDSTANNNDGDQYGNDDLAGKIGTGQNFDTGDDYIEGTSNGFSTQATTIDFWIKPNWNGNDGVSHRLYINETTLYDWDTNAIYVQKKDDSDLEFIVADDSATDYRIIETDVSGWVAGDWHHIVVSWDSSLTLKMYLDGSDITPSPSDVGTPGLPTALGPAFTMGGYPGAGGELDGILDEVRISNVDRDACWIETEHSNQNTPASFYIVGSQTSTTPGQYDQDSFRARNDNGSETTSTWTATADTNWTQMVDKNFRLRFLVQETGGTAESDKTFQLEYNLNGGGWNDVSGSSSVVKAVATANVTDAVDTTQQLGSGTYLPNNAGFDEADGLVGGASLDFSGSDEVEVEFSLQVVGTNVSNGDTIQLRVKGLDTYTSTPTITVTGAGTFLYKKSITIQEVEVTCLADVTNFPAMVQLTGADFLEVEDDVDLDGFDIFFKAEDDTTCGGAGLAPCILDHEIEVYDETNDKLVAWVRIPVLDYNNNTTIYLYYGNAAVSAATQNPTGVWDNNYKGVWHLKEATGTTRNDSTSNGNNLTDYNNVALDSNGKMAGAGNFDRLLSQSLEITDAAQTGLDITGPITVEAWVNLGETGNDPYAILYKWRGASCSNGPPYYLRATGGDVGYARENFAVTDDCLNAENGIGGSTTSMQAGNWYHLVGVYDGSNIRMYKNGGETNSAAHSTGIFDSDGNLQIGVRATGQRFDGLIDEVRISNTNRDACWIETEYSNQNTPASFYIVGSQQTTAADVYSFRKPLTIDSAQVGTSCTSTTDTWQISANDRDAWDDTSSGGLNSSIFGDSQWSDAGGYQWAVNIPQGATITSAKVRVYPTSHGGSTTSSYTARIRVEDTDNASAFTGAPNDIYTRTYWGTTIDWTIPAAGLPINTWSESPDIAGLIQHIVNKGTWSPGNYLSIAIWGETVNGTGCNEGVTDYNTNASLAAQLEVTYQTGSGSIQDFPVMVKLTGTDFQEVEDNVDADGYDIIFKAEDDTTCGGVGLAPCTLDHEIEVYDETNDLLVAWVRVPEVSATADTNIYMYYGNPAISSPTENPTGVWDPDYVSVWHLHDDFDDSAGSNNGTNYGSTNITGQIGDGQDFDGTDDYATMPTTGFSTSAGTVEAWINIDSFPSSGPEYVFAHRQASPTTDRVYVQLWDDTTWGTGMGDTYDLVRGSTLNIDTWYHLVITWDGTNVRGYRNGSLDFGPTSYVGLNTVREISIMAWDPSTEWADGTLDELRISSTPRDACWLETEYSNQKDSSTLVNVGGEEPSGEAILANHAAGQEADAFGAGGSVTGAELFAFQLSNTTGSTIAVNQVQFQLSSVTGIADTDFANLEIQVDDNGDGTIDGSDTTGAVGGTGAVDGSVTTITFSTPFNISALSTVTYILRGDVNNLVASDTVTINLGTGNITLASGSVGGSAVSSVTHTSDAADVNLADHGAGQESDAFGSGGSVTGAELFAFQLTNTTGGTVTVNQVQFQLSSVTGILDTDFANLEIQVDDNGDGTIDGSDTTGAVGGTGTVNGSVTTITFNTPFDISASATVNYILRGDVNNLVAGDTLTIDLDTNNITLSSGTVGGTAATSVTHTADAAAPEIMLDNTSGGYTNSGLNTLTFQHTIGCGSNRLLVVSIAVEGSVTYDVTDVTYNGVSLTKGVENAAGSSFYINTEIWYMLDAALPSAGTYDVVISTTGDPTETNINAGAISVTGAAQGLPEATAVNDDAEAGSATIQTDITTSTDGAWIFDSVGSGQPRNFTPFDGRTEFFDIMGASSGGAGTYEEKTTAGLETQRWDVDGTSNRISHVLVAFAPAVDTVPANLTQTHYRWRYDTGGEGGAVNWWDSNYLYRKKVTFGTNHSTLSLGYTVAVTMDTQTATTNVALTSGNDVRVIWQPTAGGYQELDRIGNTWDNANTTIEFRLQSEIDANLDEDVDGSYYIYYGNASAGTPPTNEMNVYYFADFFDRADNTDVNINSTQNWTEWITGGGDSSIVSGALNSAGNNVGPPDAGVKQTFPLGAIPADFTLTFDWTMPTNSEGTWTVYLNIGNSATMADGDRELGVGPGIYTGEGPHFNPNLVENVNNDLNDTTIMEQPVNGGPHSIRMDVDVSAYTYDYYRNGSPIASGQAFVNNENTLDQIRIANDQYSSGQPAFVYDNLKIVLNVADTPEEALGTEENSSSGAPFAELEDTKLTGLAIDTNIRLRFQVSNEGGQPSDPTVTYQLQVAETATCGSGTYTAVPTDNSGHWQIMDSSYITEPQATSDIPSGLSDPVGGTFVPGEVKEVGNTTGSIPLDACEYTEVEFVLRATEYATYSGDYCFQLYDTTNGKTLNYSKYGDVSLADGIFSYRKPITFPEANLGTSCSPNQVSATAPDTTTSAAYVLVDSMTITPGAGDYLVWFSGTLENSATGTQHVSLFLDGSQITHTEREITTESSIPGTPFVVATHAYISGVTGGQAIEVHWKTDAPTATMLERTLVVTKVSATDVMQVSEIPTNPATTTSATYEQINTMTITPGAGDYLIWFSGSIMNTTRPSVQHVSLFVNGSQLAHTEREIDQEESLTTTYFPVATHALKASVGDNEAIAVYWKRDTGTATMKARTLTVYKINAANSLEESATLDDTTTSASYTPVDSMSITPGATGNYHIWFSSSLVDPQATDTINVSLFVGGTQVLHTEREIWVEGSLDNPYQTFPVALHAYVEGVGASDVIDVRWKRTGSGTVTMHERTLVVAKVGTALSDFPALISITDTDLRDKARSDGNDIIFRWDDGTCGGEPCKGLDHEIEEWNSSTGKLIAWVRIPKVSSSNDTTIYMYYGNPSVYVSSENAAGVWDSNYQAVWHLKETTSGTDAIKDSTGNARHGTDVGSPTLGATGQIDGAVDFGNPNTTRRIDTKDFMSSGVTQFTAEAWVYKAATKDARIIYKNNVGNTGNPVFGLASGGSDTIRCRLRISDGSGTDYNVGTISLNTWTHVACTYDGSNVRAYKNGQEAGFVGETGTLAATNDVVVIAQNEAGTSADRHWPGVIDEVRVSSIARDDCWLETEFANQNNPSVFYSVGAEEGSPATAVDLVSFTAKGKGSTVLVEWETAQELNHMGFHLYRARSPWGPFTRLTDKLISGLSSSVVGRAYSFEDKDVTPGELYFYRLEDIDIYGKKTLHGPISVDWDGDGLPDDWEIAHGLNPNSNDAHLDLDGDGLTNWEEYLRGTDPLNPDTDGDGILDGEDRETDDHSQGGVRTLSPGVYILAADETGTTLELRTDSFDFKILEAEGLEFERLKIPDYIHGFTPEVGKPELPLKGILLDIPEGNSATLTVLQTEDELHTGYQVYPVPEKAVDDQAQLAHVGEIFAIDEAAYRVDSFYPGTVVRLGEQYIFRGQQKQQIVFSPLTFNPVTGEIRHYRRIRVRVDYAAGEWAKASGPEPTVWSPSVANEGSKDLSSFVQMAFLTPSMIVNPIASVLSSAAILVRTIWAPPAAATPAYKILVVEEGIYRLNKTWLEANGVDVSTIDLSEVRIYHLGQEIALYVYDDNGDEFFDPEDYIYFYARAVEESYAKYTTDNVYWLTLEGGAGAPKRMAAIDSTPTSGSIPSIHSFTVHHEEDRKYWAAAPGGDSLDRYFFDPYLYGEDIAYPGAGDPVSFDLFLPGVKGEGTLKIMMAGTWAPYHQVAVTLNGTPLGTYSWNDIAFYEATIEDVDLLDGMNTVTLECLTGVDSIAVDWFEVTYPRRFEAKSDSLTFSHETGYRFQVSEFSGDNLLAFDITSPVDVDRVVNFATIDAGGPGPYTLDFEPLIGSGERTYLTLTADQVLAPVAIIEDDYGNLANPAIGSDYILITHRDVGWDVNGDPHPWLNDLTALRQAQGLRVKVVDVEDIFDEFSYGIETPEAIRDFLAYAYTSWTQPAPQYVLLVGDSTRNPKNNPDPSLGIDTVTTYIPTYLTFTEHMGETATDEWFVRVSGDDGLSDLYIGRLPAKTADEAEDMVNKILAYEGNLNTKSWEKEVLLLADDQRDGQEYEYEAVFETMNNDVAALIPAEMNAPVTGYLNDYFDADNLKAEIIAQINSGTFMVNYSGHSSIQKLANHKVTYQNIFSTGDVATLTNNGMYPLFVSMGCLSGHFVYPEDWDFPSLAEALLRAEDKGAAAALMSTGLTTTEGQHILDTALVDTIFNQDIRVLGQAVSSAKQTLMANGGSLYEEVNETFMLFGDPAMTLKVPLPQRPEGLRAQGSGNAVDLSWDEATDCNGGGVSGYNLYRSTTPGGTYTQVNTSLITDNQYEDISVATGTTYYYVVTSVDADGDESSPSVEASGGTQSAKSVGTPSSGGGGGGGCFIDSVKAQ